MHIEFRNPNKSNRYCAFGVAVFGAAVSLIFLSDLPLCLGIILVMICVTVLGGVYWPFVAMDREGITVKFLLRKKRYRWADFVQVGIYNNKMYRVTEEYRFALVLLCPKGSKRRAGKDRHFIDRNWFRVVVLPNRTEIRNFIIKCYGSLDFDDTQDLNGWEKQYYHIG